MSNEWMPTPQPIHVGRRVFLGAMAVGLAGLLVGGRRLPGLNLLASAFSVNGFQIYTTSGIPAITEKDYRLNVNGLVDNPRTFTLADLTSMPEHQGDQGLPLCHRLGGTQVPLGGRKTQRLP